MWEIHVLHSNGELSKEADILYENREKSDFTNLLVQVINGLNLNNYFIFIDFIKAFSNGNR